MSRTHKARGRWTLGSPRDSQRLWNRYWWKSVRMKERTQLAKLEEPEPTRTRHSVNWDRF